MSSRLLPDTKHAHAPIRVWATRLDQATLEQLRTIAAQPWIEFHVAAMADAHFAEGVAVGTVFATKHTLVPAALGGDLGCGMSAVRLDSAEEFALHTEVLEAILANLQKAIPTGDATHRGKQRERGDSFSSQYGLSTHSLEHSRDALVPKHLGTLGGGNHFLELERDMEGGTWLVVHSGSRGVGAAIAAHHTRAAAAASGGGLAGLDIREPTGKAYWEDLQVALAFARANREALLARALFIIADTLGISISPSNAVEIHHNFVSRETWFGEELLVHRKGAVAVPPGRMAIIPGSMGTATYLVEGLGNPESFGSCSHGAGRVMSRKEARANVSPSALRRAMRRVVYPKHLERSLVEESPLAYRDIVGVLDAQADLVERVRRLEPLMVLKG